MISRFTVIVPQLKRQAWELQKKHYLLGTSVWRSPVKDIQDSIFPLEGSMIALEQGNVKEVRFFSRQATHGLSRRLSCAFGAL